MKNKYNAPEFEVISLLAKTAICAGEYDSADGAQKPNITLSGLVDDGE